MEKRVRTFWVVRQRFRAAANIATVVGGVIGVAIVAAAWPPGSEAWLQRTFLLPALLTVLLGALVPRLLVNAAWRLVHRHNREEWG